MPPLETQALAAPHSRGRVHAPEREQPIIGHDVTGRPFAETPEPFYVTFTDEHRYSALGDHATVSANDLRDTIHLSFWSQREPMTEEQIITFCKGAGFGHNKVSEALRKMRVEL